MLQTKATDAHSNPFVEFERQVMGKTYTMAMQLQSLVSHLYRGGVNPDIGGMLRSSDKYHRALLLSMLTWYSEHGENCREFMRIGSELSSVGVN